MFLSKYGEARHVYVPIIKRAAVDFAVGADWTPSAGDVKISKDGGAAANVTNLPTAIAMGNGAMWDFSLTATEMQAAQVMVTVADAATKAVEDTMFIVETYGHASAQHAFDLDTASTPQTGDAFARLGAPAGASVSADVAAVKAQTAAIEVDTQDLQTQVGVDGAGLTAIGDARIANLDAAVSTRLASASYTAPDNASIAAILVDTAEIGAAGAGLTALASAAALGTVDTVVDAIQLKTDNLPTDPADQSLIIDATTAIMTRLGAPAGASVSADVAAVKSDSAAVKAKTDQLTFTVAGVVDANVENVNDTPVTGNGAGVPWGPA